MKMEFIIDEEKCKKEGIDKQKCFDVIRKHFKKYNAKGTIKEIEEGFFVGTEEDFDAFSSTTAFPYSNWFLKVVTGWYWYIDEEDGKGEQKEDMMKKHYRVAVTNA